MRYYTLDLLVRRRYEEAHRRYYLRNQLVKEERMKFIKRAFIVLNIAGFIYGYYRGIQMIHSAYGGSP